MRISDWSSDVCSSDLSVAGQDAQVVGLQDRIDRGEERRRLAGLVASTATAVTVAATGLVGLGAAVDPGGAERRVLVALAIAAAARKHALCLSRAADVGAAGVAALRACGGLGPVQIGSASCRGRLCQYV